MHECSLYLLYPPWWPACMCVYIYIYIYIYIYMHEHTYTHTYIYIYARVLFISALSSMVACMYVCIHTHTHTYIHICAKALYICFILHGGLHVCVYIYTYTYTYTYTYIYARVLFISGKHHMQEHYNNTSLITWVAIFAVFRVVSDLLRLGARLALQVCTSTCVRVLAMGWTSHRRSCIRLMCMAAMQSL